MNTSFSIALSALAAQSTALDITGNNLANLSTTGFKANVASFHDLVSQSLGGGGETQLGFGVDQPLTLRQFSQGVLQSTGGPLDAAIQGDGFFVVKSSLNQTLFTRGGNFVVDKFGTVMMTTGERLQGWTTIGTVLDTNAAIGDITVPAGSLKAPLATTAISLDGNLNSSAIAGPPPDSFSSAIEVIDSLGNSHLVSVKFTKTATANQWDYSLSFPDADLTTAGTPVTGTLTFSSAGVLTSPLPGDAPPVLAVVGLLDGAADMSVTWDIYSGQVPRITQFSQPSASAALAQNGSASSNLVRVAIENGGKIMAQYSDGQQLVVGQLAMATVRNPQSLLAAGNSTYQTTARSALPSIGLPGTGGRGSVLGGSVESSNVDIAREFTNLIIYQRGYQANARVVTTADEISQETINLKR